CAARANLNAAQVRFERTNNLFKQGFIAAQDVDDARAQAESARGQVRVAQQAGAAARAEVARANAQRAAAQAQVVVAQRETQGAIATAEADVRAARASLESALANRAQKPANRRNLEALQASVRAAQGQLNQAEAQRANTVLTTPIDGVVTARSADPGTLAQPGTAVLTVQSIKRMFVEASYPVELSSQIQPGATANVTFDAVPNRKFVGRIADLNRAADPSSRQFTVRVLLENPNEVLRPGMFGRVRIVTGRKLPSVTIPLIALSETQDGPATVSVVGKDDSVEVRPVEVGIRDEDSVEILSGVKAGERVVTTRGRDLRDGANVRVTSPNAQPGQGRRRRSP
ncbi:efflux RND transporter periplasmic adaptor subunit, partial [bacterium]